MQIDVNSPAIICVGGEDAAICNSLLSQFRGELEKQVESYEYLVYSDESGDELKFFAEIQSLSLVIPYRLLVFRQAEAGLKSVLSSDSLYKNFRRICENSLERIFVWIIYKGKPSAKFLKIWGKSLLYYESKKLYETQILSYMRQCSLEHKIKLNPDAINFLVRNLKPYRSSIEQAFEKIALGL